jgi:hypothetical protein
MALIDYLREFRLDPEAIATDREVSAGLATAYANRAREQDRKESRDISVLQAATEYRRAAAHSVLLSDWKMASKMFEQAGLHYREVRISYGAMVYGCARGPNDVREFLHGYEERPRPSDRTQDVYDVLTTAAISFTVPEGIVADLIPSANSPIGVLGLPVGAYIDLARSFYFDSADGYAWGRIAQAALPFLAAYSSAIARAHESDQWDSLIFPFHPAEPDILSVLCLVESAVQQRFQRRAAELVEQIPLNPMARAILLGILEDRFGERRRQR